MSSTWIHMRYEWKMLYRTIPFWFCTVLFSSLMVLFYSAEGGPPYHNAGNSAVMFSLTLLFAYFAVTLIAVESGRRERAERTDRLRETLPYPILQWLLGRWLALLIPAILLSWIPLFIYLREIGTKLFEPGVGIGIAYLVCFAIPASFAVIAGFGIGDRVPGGWSYVVGLAFYLTFNLLIHFVLLKTPSIGMALFDMFGYINGFQFHDYSLLWGFYVDGQHWLHRLFYLCLTIVIAASILVHYTGRRREKGTRAYRWVGGGALIIAFVVPFFYFPEAAHRYAAARESTNLSLAAAESGVDSRLHPIHYNLDMQVGSSNKLDVQAIIDMRADEGEHLTELLLFLDPLFAIDRVTVNGQPAEWERAGRGGLVRIAPLTAVVGEFHISLDYSGRVKKWGIELNYNGGEKTVRRAIVSPHQVWLPYDLVWYPMTSRQLIAMVPYTGVRPFGSRNADIEPAPVGYDLTITHHKPMFLFTSDYTEHKGTRDGQQLVTQISAISEEPLMLMGGAFQLLEAEGTHTQVSLIATNQANRTAAERSVEGAARLLDRMFEFMERTKTLHGLDAYLPTRLTLLPIYDANYPTVLSRDVGSQLQTGKYTQHFRYGWLEVDESYPSGFVSSEWSLLWQWLEVLHEEDGTAAPMWTWLSTVRDYILADSDEGMPFANKEYRLDSRVAIIFDLLRREEFEVFVWDYFHILTGIDPNLPEREKYSVSNQFLIGKVREARGERAIH